MKHCFHELRDTVGNFISPDIRENSSIKELQPSIRIIHGSLQIKKNKHKFYDMTNFFAKIYSSFRAS